MAETDSIFKESGTNEIYCAIKDEINPHCQKAKIFVEGLWQKAHKYLDPDALKDLPIQFHQRFWEIYLAVALLDVGLNLSPSTGQDGPDICIKDNDGLKIWVEAVTASSGQGSDAVQEVQYGTMTSVPDDKIKLRLLNAFSEKNRKYKCYREKKWISSDEPYVIAINASQVPFANLEHEIPIIVRSLLPFGFKVFHLNKKTSEVTGTSYDYQGEVVKLSGAEIETTSFLNPKFSGISAVIYSCANVFNCPDEISDALLLFHNPLAVNPLPPGFLRKGCEYWVDDQHLKNKNWNQE
jgi:hypothetical protein